MIGFQTTSLLVLLACIAWRITWPILLAWSTAKETAIGDLIQFDKLSRKEPSMNNKRKETCVVIGGGLSGCITAAIATRHYEKVIIVEVASDKSKLKDRTMQYNQAHVFGPFVIEALQVLWPNIFVDELVKRGGHFLNLRDVKFQFQLNKCSLQWDKRLAKFGLTGQDAATFSRPMMQDLLVDLTKMYTPGIKYVYGKVTDISYSADGVTVNKVRVVGDNTATDLECHAVFDCSGNAKAYKKLIKNNPRFKEPKTENYRMNLSYSTALIDVDQSVAERLPLPKNHSNGTWREASMVLLVAPLLTQSTQGAIMSHTDANRYYISGNHYNTGQSDMPQTLDAYRTFVKQCYHGAVGDEIGPWFDETIDLLQENEILMEEKAKFYTCKDEISYITLIDPKNRRLPPNLALVGDSYSKLNPAYGQGTAKCVMDALTLSTCLEQESNTSKAIQAFDKLRAPKSYGLFDFNRAMDLSSNELVSINQGKESKGKELRAMMKPLLKYMHKYNDVAKMNALCEVMFGASGSLALMHPSMIFAIIWGSFLN